MQAKKLKEAFTNKMVDLPSLRVPFVTVNTSAVLFLSVLHTIFAGHLHAPAFYCVIVATLQVFLDEVNTSSCLGLFKEIIIDRTFDGNVSDL